MRAFEIPELDELVVNEAGVAIGDGEVALALFYRQSWSVLVGIGAGGIDEPGRTQEGSVVECRFAMGEVRDGAAGKQGCAERLSLPG